MPCESEEPVGNLDRLIASHLICILLPPHWLNMKHDQQLIISFSEEQYEPFGSFSTAVIEVEYLKSADQNTFCFILSAIL